MSILTTFSSEKELSKLQGSAHSDVQQVLSKAVAMGRVTRDEGSMPFCVELDNLKDTDAPIHQPAAMLVAAD